MTRNTIRLWQSFLLLCALTVPALAQAGNKYSSGSIDRSFGDGGGAAQIGIPGLGALDLHRTPDGRAVTSYSRLLGPSGPEIWIGKYLASGLPDTSFGTNGAAKVPGSESLFAQASAIQPDGKLVIVGKQFLTLGTRNDIFVARVGTEGLLDSTFASNGVFLRDLSAAGQGSDDELFGVNVLPDGRLLLVGSRSVWVTTSEIQLYLILMILLPDGTPDETFGKGGLTSVHLGPGLNGGIRGRLETQSNGNILVGASVYLLPDPQGNVVNLHQIFRFLANGSLDGEFSCDGMVQIADRPVNDFQYLTTLPDGKVFSLSGRGQLTRLLQDGSFDPTFGEGGKRFIQNIYPYSLTVLPSGKLLVAGTTMETALTNRPEAAIARFFPDGTRDLRFGRSGLIRFKPAGTGTQLGYMVPLSDSSYLIQGMLRVDGEPVTLPRSFVLRLTPGK